LSVSVSFDEALEVLGVEAGADGVAVRRAYLRLVKKHNPERDPDGFRRVREAYEIARAGRPFVFGAIHAPIGETAPRPSSTPPAQDDPLPPSALDEAERALREVAFGDHDRRIEIARGAVAGSTGPDLQNAYWTLVETLDDAERPDEALDVLDEGIAAGLDELRAARVRRRPDAATDADIEYARKTGDGSLLVAIARGVASIDPERATELALEGAHLADDVEYAGALEYELVDLVFDLHVAGAPEHARRVYSELSERLAQTSGERWSRPAGARLALARELCDLPLDFDLDARRALAEAARDETLDDLTDAVDRVLGGSWFRPSKATRALARHAPTLYRAVRDARPSEPKARLPSVVGLGALFVVLLALRSLTSGACSQAPSLPSPAVYDGIVASRVDRATSGSIDNLCPFLGDRSCARARLITGFFENDCATARRELEWLDREVASIEERNRRESPAARAALATVTLGVARSCPSGAPP
jgi:hypothetical protein